MSLKNGLASQSAIIFATRMLGAGLIFMVQAAMARIWGAEILGEYLLIIAALNLAAVVMPLGFQTVGTYFAAEYCAKKDGAMLRRFVRRSYAHVFAVGAVLGVFGAPLVRLAGAPGQAVADIWLPSVLLAVSTAVIFVNSALLVGLRRPMLGFFSETLFRPLVIIGCFAIGLTLSDGREALHSMLWAFAGGYVIVALGQAALVFANVKNVPVKVEARPAEGPRWWRFAAPWVLVSLATDFYFDIDLLMVSGYLSHDALAVFGICTRIFSLVAFGVTAVYAVTLPDMFEAEAKNNRAGFHAKISEANLVASAIALALVLAVAIGGGFALQIFGPEFAVGRWPLVILCLGLLVRACFGPASLVLSIHDRPFASLPAVGLGLVSLAVLNYWLVPQFALVGAAIAALTAIIIWSIGLWFTAWHYAGVDVSILARFRTSNIKTANVVLKHSRADG